MNHSKISIAFGELLEQQLYEMVDGHLVSQIISRTNFDIFSQDYRKYLEGYSFRVTSELASHYNGLLKQVQSTLNFDEDIDFYITNSPELNAFAFTKPKPNHAHIIGLHSEAIEKFTDEELKFVMGHEMGHLIRKKELRSIIQFIYKEKKQMPLILEHKIKLWEKVSELTADRFGFLAVNDLQTAVSALFKLSSGIDPKKIDFDLEAYLRDNDQKLESLKQNSNIHQMSHPFDPIRVKALELFSNSNLVQQIHQDTDTIHEDKELENQTAHLIDILMTTSYSELDHHRKNFIAAGGLIVSQLDDHLSKEEYNKILEVLSNFMVFPGFFLDRFSQNENLGDILNQSIQNILEIKPSERYPMFDFLCELVLVDNNLFSSEVDFLFEFGKKAFGFASTEISQRMAEILSHRFYPNVYEI